VKCAAAPLAGFGEKLPLTLAGSLAVPTTPPSKVRSTFSANPSSLAIAMVV
jgi:hypothetical protein